MMAKGVIPFDNPYSIWTIGIPQKDYQNKIMEEADLVIAVGYDIVEYAPAKWNPEGKIDIVHVDMRPAHINKLYQPEVEVVGDIADALVQIGRRTSRRQEPERALEIKQMMVEEHESYASDDSFPMKPQRILNDVRRVMGREDIVISDVGAHKMWIARHYNCYEPNTCIISNGFATMGISVPGAIGAKLVYPEKKILAVCGDGHPDLQRFQLWPHQMETDGPVRKELLCRFYESGFCEVCGKYGGNWLPHHKSRRAGANP